MTMHAPVSTTAVPTDKVVAALVTAKQGLMACRVIPYLGPDLLAEYGASIPTTPEALATALNAKSPVPSRIRRNLSAVAQFIESYKHRKTLTKLMSGIFQAPVAPTALHRALARWPLPLIVDTWYDGAMRTALAESGRADWGEIQGATRAGVAHTVWTRAYDASGAEVDPASAAGWTTVLYKPHGAVVPAANYLVSDSDYVEVLTEIDIQTPIPDLVKDRRRDGSFLYLGARFHDQTLRTFARQIAKRSAGGHCAVIERAQLTRNEVRFLDEAGIKPIDCSLAAAVGILTAD